MREQLLEGWAGGVLQGEDCIAGSWLGRRLCHDTKFIS